MEYFFMFVCVALTVLCDWQGKLNLLQFEMDLELMKTNTNEEHD